MQIKKENPAGVPGRIKYKRMKRLRFRCPAIVYLQQLFFRTKRKRNALIIIFPALLTIIIPVLLMICD
jgi:hypothetical protein